MKFYSIDLSNFENMKNSSVKKKEKKNIQSPSKSAGIQKKSIFETFFPSYLNKCFTYHSTFPLLEFQFSIKTG